MSVNEGRGRPPAWCMMTGCGGRVNTGVGEGGTCLVHDDRVCMNERPPAWCMMIWSAIAEVSV